MIYALLFNQNHLKFLAEQKKEKDGIEGDNFVNIYITTCIYIYYTVKN